MKALAVSSRDFKTKTLVATYKAIVRPIFNYASPIWFTQVPSSHLDKLEVIHNKALRIATGCHQTLHLLYRPPPPPFKATLQASWLILQHSKRPASKKWRPQRPSHHFWWRAGGSSLSLSQTPPMRPDDTGDRPVPGIQQSAHGHSPSNWPSRTTAAPVLAKSASFYATARGSSPTATP